MKITLELLRLYIQGECSEVEKRAVEFWLEDFTEPAPTVSPAEMEGIKAEVWRDIATVFPERDPKTISQGRKVFPGFSHLNPFALESAWSLSAVACLLIFVFLSGIFMGGHLQASEIKPVQGNAHTAEKAALIIHNRDKRTAVKGREFSFLFKGALLLSNNSDVPLAIRFSLGSDTVFTLLPGHSYYLMGSNESPTLIENTGLRHDEIQSLTRTYASFTVEPKPAS